MSNMLLEAKEIHTYYGASHILHGIDFNIREGEGIALMGRNGMGKSTLIKSMLGIVRPRHGRVLVRGDDYTRARTFQTAQQGIAYVPEGRGIFKSLSVRENLLMSARAGVDGRREWTFDRVMATFPRLGERINNGGWQLSGGEQQMLAIGRALMTNPLLIVLDEATEGLAPQVVAEIWRVIASIRRDGIAALIVDRDHRRVASHAERLLVLQKGQVALEGTAAELRDTPGLLQYLGL